MPLQCVHQTALTRTSAFQRHCRWAFTVCDGDGTGRIQKAELYAGILLVHLELAKYAGSAACYPPSRQTVEGLFDASDDDNSGFIDQDEFQQIMVICCAQITGRIVAFYAVLILLVPRMTGVVVHGFLALDDSMGWGVGKTGIYVPGGEWLEMVFNWGQIGEQVVYLALFFLVIPTVFNWIDKSSQQAAVAHVSVSPAATAERDSSRQ
jgi:hypothetical protein